MTDETRFITWPSIYLIAKPEFIEPAHMRVTHVEGDDATDGDRLGEFAGRVCYMSQHNPARKTVAQYIENILDQAHGSVLEHAVYVFLLEGISRSCSHELVRHRAGFGYSQLSQRYVDESDTNFVVPIALLDEPELQARWRLDVLIARATYKQLSDKLYEKYASITDKTTRRKMAREAARSVLPNATETKVVVSGNIRAWRTMLELRCGLGADVEIRRTAIEILHKLKLVAPAAFQDTRFITADDGRLYAEFGHHKV